MKTESIAIILILVSILGLFWWLLIAGRQRTLEHQRALLDRIPLGSIGLDPAQRVLHWNPAIARMTQLPAKRVVGRPLHDIDDPWGGPLSQYLHAPGEATQESHVGGLHLSLHKSRLSNDAQMPTVILVEDRTHASAMTQKLAHQDRLASMGQLAAGVAHEIGNPLTGIDSLAQLMRADQAENRDLIREQVRRINRIIRSLLKFSAEREVQAPQQIIEVDGLIDDSLRLFQLDPQHQQIELIQRRRIPRQVFGDPIALSQVLINLLKNSAQAMQTDTPTIWIDCFENGHGQLQLDIEDNGHGIPPELLPKVFEPFVSSHLDEGGTGLGLAICYGIVEQHNGTIVANSPTAGGGTQMSITLPIHQEA